MNIAIVLPYENASKYYRIWAHDEEKIDFKNDNFSSERCTISYAAEELFCYLEKMGHTVSVADAPEGEINIFLSSDGKTGEEFDILREGNNLYLKGESRKALLYAVYELLETQGISWYSPYEEYVPISDEFVFPQCKHYKYDMKDGRGFHFEQLLKESRKFIVWMARNRLNMHLCHTHSKKL